MPTQYTGRTEALASAIIAAASQTDVTATGTVAARSLGDRFLDWVTLKDWGAIGDGVTDDTVAWQTACEAIDNNILVITEGTYIIGDKGTVTNKGAIFVHKGAILKLKDGTILNTDSSSNHFTPILRIEGVDGFVIDGIEIDGNRDGQTYPATLSNFGRGGSNSRRHNGCIEVCSNGVDKSKNITIQNSTIYNSYLSGCMFIQCEGVRITNNTTKNNTWNGFGGGENTDVIASGNKSYRDGVSTDFPDTQNSGDRGAFQFRELGSGVTTATDGLPIITGTDRTNTSIIIVNNYIEESCVIGAFIRACKGGIMTNNTVKNVGYSRASTDYIPAALWMEWGDGQVRDNNIIQDRDNSASGWLKPDAIVAFGLTGDGGQGSAQAQDVLIDGTYTVSVTGNKIYCGQNYDGVVNYTTDARKEINFLRGIRSDIGANLDGNTIEGTESSFISLLADQNFSALWPKRIKIRNNIMWNSTASNPITITGGAGSPAGSLEDIEITGNTIFDLRSVATGGEDRIVIHMVSNFTSVPVINLNISRNTVDCSNSADAAKLYLFTRLRGDETSYSIRVHNNRVNTPSALATMTKFAALSIKDNTVQSPTSGFAFALAANCGMLEISENKFLGCTSSLGVFTPGAFTMDVLIMKGNTFTGSTTTFMSGLTPGVCPKVFDYSGNANLMTISNDPASLADGSGVTVTSSTRPNFKLGEFILSSFSLDLQGIWLSPYVSANGAIAIRLENETTGTIDLGAGAFRIVKRELRTTDLHAAVVYDPPSLAINGGTSTTLTVNGAQLGDFAIASFDKNMNAVSMFAYVSAANTVTVILQNQSGTLQDLASGVLKAIVVPKDSVSGITGTATYDPASLNDGDGVTTTVTVTGARLGDIAMVSFSLDLQGIICHAWVSAADTVSVRFQNETTGVLDLGSGTITCSIDSNLI